MVILYTLLLLVDRGDCCRGVYLKGARALDVFISAGVLDRLNRSCMPASKNGTGSLYLSPCRYRCVCVSLLGRVAGMAGRGAFKANRELVVNY